MGRDEVRQDVFRTTGKGFQRDQQVHRLPRQEDQVRVAPLHPFLRDGPQALAEVDLAPLGVGQLALPDHRQHEQRHGGMVQEADLFRRQGGVAGRELRDAGRTDQLGGILDLLPPLDGPPVDLVHDLARMEAVAGAPRSTMASVRTRRSRE